MHITALFDKSFIQSLSIDESVWFDHFFTTVICPIFFVETLADLSKEPSIPNRTPEDEVSKIADRFPEMHGYPSAHHNKMIIADALQNEVPMYAGIPSSRGQHFRHNGTFGVRYDSSPEAEAFARWQNREFSELEAKFAFSWRKSLSELRLQENAQALQKMGFDFNACKSEMDARRMASSFVNATSDPIKRMSCFFEILGIPGEFRNQIFGIYSSQHYPRFSEFSPYASFVFEVEIFFNACISKSIISPERPSNKIDISYLFYLPFCHVFVSNDKLHKRTSKHFLSSTQRFVWGPDLKADLAQINQEYMQLPEQDKLRGIISLSPTPPKSRTSVVADIWDSFSKSWRSKPTVSHPISNHGDSKIIQDIKEKTRAPLLSPGEAPSSEEEPEFMLLERKIHRKKGSWFQVPHGIKDED